MHDMLHSYQSRGTARPGECTMRQIVACAVCAMQNWIDDFYPCNIWKDAPSSTTSGTTEHDSEHDTDHEEEHNDTHNKGPLLRNEHDFCYFGPPQKIHAHLDVELYVPVVPLTLLEEGHASSV